MKPIGKSQGKGIFLVNKLSQISQWRNSPRILGSSNVHRDEDIGPEAYIIQRYIDNPYLISGKKFDIRIYVLVISYAPLIVYIHRLGFCRFSNYQFSLAKEDIHNLYIHATNVAVQKTAPDYNCEKGCKWLLRNFRIFLGAKHGQAIADAVFTEMEAIVVRSLMSVQKVIIADRHCFELYGYDILIDQDLKPYVANSKWKLMRDGGACRWLLEVNASPSLSVENQMDYELKCMVLSDMLQVVDMENKYTDQARQKVGGFDLVFNDGPVSHKNATHYTSFLAYSKTKSFAQTTNHRPFTYDGDGAVIGKLTHFGLASNK